MYANMLAVSSCSASATPTNGPIARSARSAFTCSRCWPLAATTSGSWRRRTSIITPPRSGNAANARNPIRHEPVIDATPVAITGAAANASAPPITCVPSARPRAAVVYVPARNDAAGAWYVEAKIPTNTRSGTSCQKDVVNATSPPNTPTPISPIAIISLLLTRSANAEIGSCAKPSTSPYAESSSPERA